MVVTCLKAAENAAVLVKPACVATVAIAAPRESCPMAQTIRTRCRQAFSVIPVSNGNSLLAVRTEVAARDASSPRLRVLRWSVRAMSANRLPKVLFGKGRNVGASSITVNSCNISLTMSSALSDAGSITTTSSIRERNKGGIHDTNARAGKADGAQSRIAAVLQRTIQSWASVMISSR